MARELTREAEADRAEFIQLFGHDGDCFCHLCPPCASCVHPGNPVNQEENEACWEEVPDHE
jgi:hypothetical protein